ncbi:unnamed protein product [Vitrella brassicaformis CCMP3155]|uniref:endo-1,4-beta-xylanase n=2 Tax=Vitrella brassicaformis TaxID=1169539 RepID=A0A0G4EHQ7_VITBC|nr:unnamed protein product [Vitrella brassicaformis CCMP3155]|eukprot:CEL96107.1 unnamed protein product [Vitrella brassicaformis CCMP3155]
MWNLCVVLALLTALLPDRGIAQVPRINKVSNWKSVFPKKAVRRGQPGTFRHIAWGKNLFFGCAVSIYNQNDFKQYRDITRREFNMIVAKSECKMRKIMKVKNKGYDWKECDALLDLAKKEGQYYRYHAIAWYSSTPGWVNALPQKQFRDLFIKFTKDAIKRYAQPRVQSWDVANEALEQTQKSPAKNPKWRKSMLYKKFPDHLEVLHRVAKNEASRLKKPARLFYNDFGAESSRGWMKGKADAIFHIVKQLRARGAPIDGVGFQAHLSLDWSDYNGVAQNFKRLGQMGLEVQLTEVDVTCGRPVKGKWQFCQGWNQKKREQQAKIFAGMLRVCMKAPNCTAFVTWGVSDRWTWRPKDHPFIYDAKFNKKPAWFSLMNTLKAN